MCRDSAVSSKSWGVAVLFSIEKRNCLQEMSRDSEEVARDWTSFVLCLVSTRKVDTFPSNYLGFVVKRCAFTRKVEDIVMTTSNEIMRAALGVIAFPEKGSRRQRRRATRQRRSAARRKSP